MSSKSALRDKVRRLRHKLRKLRRSKLARKLNSSRVDVADMSDAVDEWMKRCSSLEDDAAALMAANSDLRKKLAHIDTALSDARRSRGTEQFDKDEIQEFRAWRVSHTAAIEKASAIGQEWADRYAALQRKHDEQTQQHERDLANLETISNALGGRLLGEAVSPNRFDRLVLAAARIRNFDSILEKAIAAHHKQREGLGWNDHHHNRDVIKGVVDGLQIAASLYKGTERHPIAPPLTGTYLDNGFLLEDVQVILDMTHWYIHNRLPVPDTRWQQIHLILTQISNSGDLKADFTQGVNELVGELRRRRAVEISLAPPKTN